MNGFSQAEADSGTCYNSSTLLLIGCLGTPNALSLLHKTSQQTSLRQIWDSSQYPFHPRTLSPTILPLYIALAAVIMAFLNLGTRLSCKQPLAPKPLSSRTYPVLDASLPLEEEGLPHYNAADWYPVFIGEIFLSRYQVLGKLGFGLNSTVWLSRDLQ